MSKYSHSSDEELALAQSIQNAFAPCTPPGPKRNKKKKSGQQEDDPRYLSITLDAVFSSNISLSIQLNGEFIFLEDEITRACETTFEAIIYPEELNQLDIRLQFGKRSYNLSTEVVCYDENQSLRINQWTKKAPPRIYWNGDQINRGVGLHLSQTNEFVLCDLTSHVVFLMNGDVSDIEFGEPVDIYINDELVKNRELDWIHRNVPVEHSAWLPLGCHRIVVISRRRGWTILDTDIVVDGVNDVKVIWSNANLSSAEVEVKYGPETVFQQSRELLNFIETAAKFGESRNRRIVIDGVKVPKGLEKFLERIKGAKKYSEAMIKNFTTFLLIKKTIAEKKRDNKRLTAEEKEVDQLKEYKDLDNWIDRRKRKEGYNTRIDGTTDFGGDMKFLGPKPKNAFEELQKKVTMEVHEPSHVEGFKKKALSVGLDLDKINEFLKVLKKVNAEIKKGKSANDVINDLNEKDKKIFIWGYFKNKEKLAKYFALCNDLIDSAKEEIQEYEAEVKFYNELINKLQEKGAQKDGQKIPYSYLIRVIKYFHSIRGHFKNLPPEEKKKMREQLEKFKKMVKDSTTLSDHEKTELNRLLDEALEALK